MALPEGGPELRTVWTQRPAGGLGPEALTLLEPPAPAVWMSRMRPGTDGPPFTLVGWAPVWEARAIPGSSEALDALVRRAAALSAPAGLPPLCVALCGVIAPDALRAARPPAPGAASSGRLSGPGPLPGLHFFLPGRAILLDPGADRLWLVAHLRPGEDGDAALADLGARLDAVRVRAAKQPAPARAPVPASAAASWDREAYGHAVRAVQAAIRAGTVRKAVLSVRFTVPYGGSGWDLARALPPNPGGLSFLVDGGGWALAGATPELLAVTSGRRLRMRPLAGTRPRQGHARADRARAMELQASLKEQAEHHAALEQIERDLEAIAVPGSVRRDAVPVLEEHPGTIHLATGVEATLRPEVGPAEVLRAVFPAGTVTGVPREAATKLIERLEPVPRRLYGGAVGVLLPAGDLELWLVIRCALISGGLACAHAGAGVVEASDPDAEYDECLTKAAVCLGALERAAAAAGR